MTSSSEQPPTDYNTQCKMDVCPANIGGCCTATCSGSLPNLAPAQCPHWKDSGNLKSDCRDQGIWKFYCSKPMAEHDAAIARTATLAELKALYEYAKDNPHGQGFASGVDEWIKLRQSTTAAQEPHP